MNDDSPRDRLAVRLGVKGKKHKRLVEYLGNDRAEDILEVANNRGWWLLEDEDSGQLVLITKEEFSEVYRVATPSLASGMRYVIDISEYTRKAKFIASFIIPVYYIGAWIKTLPARISWMFS